MAFKFVDGGSIRINSTDVSIPVLMITAADGTEDTGLAHTDITGSYIRQGGSRTAITMANLAAIDSAHSDGGWEEADATNLPGLYRFDIPDAAFADGADWVVLAAKATSDFTYYVKFALTYDGLIRTAVPQAHGANSITLDASASATDDTYNGMIAEIVDSDAAADLGAQAFITDYNGTTKVATLGNGWEGRAPTGTAANMTFIIYTALPLVKSLWQEFSRSGSTLTFKYGNGDTARTQTETRTASLDTLTGLS